MQSLNDDDMEELFRKAGEEYPLNTNGADWNKVLQGLHHTENDLPEENKQRKDYRYLLLLLLLPLGFIIGRYIGNDKKGAGLKSNKGINITTATGDKAKALNKSPRIQAEQQESEKTTANPAVIRTEEINKINANKSSLRNINTNKPATNYSKVNNTFSKSRINSLETNVQISKTSKEKPGNLKSEEATVTEKNIIITENASDSNNTVVPVDTVKIASGNEKASIESNKEDSANSKKSSKKAQTLNLKKFYYSFVFGPDVSTIKFHNNTKAGYSLGLMLGYNLNKKIAVEAGALWDRKRYDANGEYLDTSKLGLPPWSALSRIFGYCDMIEIPVNVKYTWATKKNHSWFVSAGLSSYIMKNEAYNLTYARYSMPYVKDYNYKNSSKDWFSIMNVSAGYQTLLGRSTSLSIAPYIKLPLKGVGIGKLPITSTGIYISVSRSAW